MDDALQVGELVTDTELESAIIWVLGIAGALLALVGLYLWLATGAQLLFLPAGLILVGVALIAIPGLLLELAQIAG